MAISDKRQAILDAITAIQNARLPAPQDINGPLPPQIDIDIDPDLLVPQQNQTPNNLSDVDIDDPDDVLAKQKQTNQQCQQSQQDKKSTGNANKQDDNSAEEEEEEEASEPGKKGKQASDTETTDSEEKNSDYANAWNAIMDTYDIDNITSADLRRLIRQISDGTITSL